MTPIVSKLESDIHSPARPTRFRRRISLMLATLPRLTRPVRSLELVSRTSLMMMTTAALTTALFVGASTATAQSSSNRSVTVTLVNGTNRNAVTAEKLTVFRLSGQMVPIVELERVSSPTTIRDIEVTGPGPVLLQVTYQGVNYNQPVRFASEANESVEIQVYETTDAWDPQAFQITTSRALYRRYEDRLSVDEVLVFENRTDPPTTFSHPDGSFRFHLPSDGLLEVRGVTASGASGMPVPQQSFSIEGTTYGTRTAFKPGETQIAVSYDVQYGEEGFAASSQAYYPLNELLVLLAPADMNLEGERWELLGPEPEGRFSVARLANIEPGDSIDFRIFGGSREAGDLVRSSQTPNANTAAPTARTITRLPDTTRSGQWIVALLLGAALAFGLLFSVMAPPTRGTLTARLKALESQFKTNGIDEGRYRSERDELEARLRDLGQVGQSSANAKSRG